MTKRTIAGHVAALLLTALMWCANIVAQDDGLSLSTEEGQRLFIGDSIAIAQTEYGRVHGFIKDNIYNFKGIPYAATTAGKNRFMPPLPPQTWNIWLRNTDLMLTHTGNPNCPSMPEWKPYNQEDGWTMMLSDECRLMKDIDREARKNYSAQYSVQRLPLGKADWHWNRELVQIDDVPAEQTAVYEATDSILTIGPWIASRHDVKLVAAHALPARKGSVRGQFRTEGMYPREGNIWIAYRQDRRTITETNYWIGTADSWTDFAFPVFDPPAGCDSIVVSFGFHMKTPARFFIRDLRFDVPIDLDPAKKTAPQLAPHPVVPHVAVLQQQTKLVTLAHEGDAWTLVAPDGHPFFSIGCAMYGNRLSPAESAPALYEMGFNTIANGSNLEQWSAYNQHTTNRQFFQFYRVNTEVGRGGYDCLVDRDGLHPGETKKPTRDVGGFNHAFPDPFDPRWEDDARRQVRQVAEQFHDKPYFMGWMAANERSHWNLYRYVWSPGCAREFDRFLRSKYKTVKQLNRAWKTDFKSFEDLQEQRPEPLVIRGRKYEDFNAFSRIILRTFNEKILRIIHEEDPGRLVFTNRFMIHEVRGVFDNLDLYKGFDGVAVNIYPSNNEWGLNLGERQYLELMHRKTGLPLIICEWSVPARDSHLYDNTSRLDWSFPQLMETQKQRAAQAVQVLADLWNMPFMVGAHWFTWGDFNGGNRQSNRGLYTSDGQPWSEVQKALRDVNWQINNLIY